MIPNAEHARFLSNKSLKDGKERTAYVTKYSKKVFNKIISATINGRFEAKVILPDDSIGPIGVVLSLLGYKCLSGKKKNEIIIFW